MLAKIMRINSIYHGFDEGYTETLKGVTDWEEISDEDANILEEAGYVVIRQLNAAETTTTVAQLKAEYLKQKKEREIRHKRYKEDEKAREAKILQRKLEKAKKLLEEHGN